MADSKVMQAVRVLRRAQRKGVHWWQIQKSIHQNVWEVAALAAGQTSRPTWYLCRNPVDAAKKAVAHALDPHAESETRFLKKQLAYVRSGIKLGK